MILFNKMTNILINLENMTKFKKFKINYFWQE